MDLGLAATLKKMIIYRASLGRQAWAGAADISGTPLGFIWAKVYKKGSDTQTPSSILPSADSQGTSLSPLAPRVPLPCHWLSFQSGGPAHSLLSPQETPICRPSSAEYSKGNVSQIHMKVACEYREKKEDPREKWAPHPWSTILLCFWFLYIFLGWFHTSKVFVRPLSWQELQVFYSSPLQSLWRHTCLRGSASLSQLLLQLWTQQSWHQ